MTLEVILSLLKPFLLIQNNFWRLKTEKKLRKMDLKWVSIADFADFCHEIGRFWSNFRKFCNFSCFYVKRSGPMGLVKQLH